jgi:hypothetical protein
VATFFSLLTLRVWSCGCGPGPARTPTWRMAATPRRVAMDLSDFVFIWLNLDLKSGGGAGSAEFHLDRPPIGHVSCQADQIGVLSLCRATYERRWLQSSRTIIRRLLIIVVTNTNNHRDAPRAPGHLTPDSLRRLRKALCRLRKCLCILRRSLCGPRRCLCSLPRSLGNPRGCLRTLRRSLCSPRR